MNNNHNITYNKKNKIPILGATIMSFPVTKFSLHDFNHICDQINKMGEKGHEHLKIVKNHNQWGLVTTSKPKGCWGRFWACIFKSSNTRFANVSRFAIAFFRANQEHIADNEKAQQAISRLKFRWDKKSCSKEINALYGGTDAANVANIKSQLQTAHTSLAASIKECATLKAKYEILEKTKKEEDAISRIKIAPKSQTSVLLTLIPQLFSIDSNICRVFLEKMIQIAEWRSWKDVSTETQERFFKFLSIRAAHIESSSKGIVEKVQIIDQTILTMLGMCYFKGIGTEIAPDKSFKMFSRLTEYAPAQYCLTLLNPKEKGDSKIISAAASAGWAPALTTLGRWHDGGNLGYDQDPLQATTHYTIATSKGCAIAQYFLGTQYLKTTENVDAGVQLLKLSALQGYSLASLDLGYYYMNTVKNDEESFKYFLAAAEEGHKDAQNNVAACYAKGAGTIKSMKEAVKWFSAAAEQGVAQAQFNLAKIYEKGSKDTPPDQKKAIALYKSAGANGFERANAALETLRKSMAAEQSK